MSNPESYKRFHRLLTDAIDIIDSADPSREVNRASIMSAMKLNKLVVAEKRATESLSLVLDLTTRPSVILESIRDSSKNIDNIGNLIVYNNEAYFRIMSAISEDISKS